MASVVGAEEPGEGMAAPSAAASASPAVGSEAGAVLRTAGFVGGDLTVDATPVDDVVKAAAGVEVPTATPSGMAAGGFRETPVLKRP